MPDAPILSLVLLAGHLPDDELLDVVLHKSAHHWLGATPTLDEALDTRDVANATGAALIRAFWDGGLMAEILDAERRSEEEADALARRWGAAIAGTAEADNAATKRRASNLAAVHGRIGS
jgi:hypothetical protein